MKRVPPPSATKIARRLRSGPTEAETRLWRLLREAFPEARFRRQVPIRQYIVDFASHRARLVIEADGGQHNDAVDAARTAIIEADGYRVLRFWNHDILDNPEGVAQSIAEAFASRTAANRAPPLDGEGLGRGEASTNAAPVEASPPPNPPPSRGRASARAGGDRSPKTEGATH